MIETSVTYVSSQISVNVFRIDAIAISSGIATAGSVPKMKSRMISAPSAPISASTSTLGGRRLSAAARLGVERVDAGQVAPRRPPAQRPASASFVDQARRARSVNCPAG